MKNRSAVRSSYWLVGIAAFGVGGFAEAGPLYSFSVIEGPDPGLGGEFTYVQAISDTHLIVGWSHPNDPCAYSFVDDAGAFTLVNVPPSVATPPSNCAQATGINNRGDVVGSFGDANVQTHGFLLDAGTFTTIDVPPATGAVFTLAQGINNLGTITGYYVSVSGAHGFIDKGGTFSFFDAPGALDTYPHSINDLGQVAGYSFDGTAYHGFLKTSGRIASIDVPGVVDTYAMGVNDFGIVVGFEDDATGQHGFIRDIAGFTPFDFPGGRLTELTGLNNLGQIVGSTFPPALGQRRGFLATPISLMEVLPLLGAVRLNQPLITVVILSTPSFNAPSAVDTQSLTFGRTGTEQSLSACKVTAGNLVCSFSTSISAFQCGDTTAILQGQLTDGTPIRGADGVTIAHCKN